MPDQTFLSIGTDQSSPNGIHSLIMDSRVSLECGANVESAMSGISRNEQGSAWSGSGTQYSRTWVAGTGGRETASPISPALNLPVVVVRRWQHMNSAPSKVSRQPSPN